MRAVQVAKGSTGLEGLRFVEIAEPTPGANEVLLRVRAVSLNYRDLLIAKGFYAGGPLADDMVIGSDCAGEVAAVGAGVTRVRPGDRVVGSFMQCWHQGKVDFMTLSPLGQLPAGGVLSEYRVFSEQDLVILPDAMSFEQGATFPCAGVTAWTALHTIGQVGTGDNVLVLGTGGVSIMALQLARAAGAEVILTSSSDKKLERAKGLGIKIGINYRTTPAWGEEVRRLTDGRGAEIVVDSGGVGNLQQSMEAVSMLGRIALVGIITGIDGQVEPGPLVMKAAGVSGVLVGPRSALESVIATFDKAGIEPVIDKVFAFDKAIEAYRYLDSGSHFGKLVVRID